MLVSKITPSAKKIVNSDPFNVVTEDLNYMSIIARPYVAGSEKVNFQINYGTIKLNDKEEPVGFSQGSSSKLTMTSDEIETWGTDDSVLFSLVAGKLNISIVEIVEVPGGMF
jgi:hypothetical protein